MRALSVPAKPGIFCPVLSFKFRDKIIDYYKKNLKGKTLGVLGLSFKPNTDDMREAPSIFIIKALLKRGANIKAYDPVAILNAKKYIKNVSFVENPYEVANASDGLIIMTEWNEFRNLNLDRIRHLMNRPVIFDGRNIYEKETLKMLGFRYFGVGY